MFIQSSFHNLNIGVTFFRIIVYYGNLTELFMFNLFSWFPWKRKKIL